LANKGEPKTPDDLPKFDALKRYSQTTNHVMSWQLKSLTGEQVTLDLPARAILNDPDTLCHAAMAGLGIAQVPLTHAYSYLQKGELVRVLPEWYAERGVISLYFAAKKLLPAKTRVFVDFIVDKFRTEQLSDKWNVSKLVKKSNWNNWGKAQHKTQTSLLRLQYQILQLLAIAGIKRVTGAIWALFFYPFVVAVVGIKVAVTLHHLVGGVVSESSCALIDNVFLAVTIQFAECSRH